MVRIKIVLFFKVNACLGVIRRAAFAGLRGSVFWVSVCSCFVDLFFEVRLVRLVFGRRGIEIRVVRFWRGTVRFFFSFVFFVFCVFVWRSLFFRWMRFSCWRTRGCLFSTLTSSVLRVTRRFFSISWYVLGNCRVVVWWE